MSVVIQRIVAVRGMIMPSTTKKCKCQDEFRSYYQKKYEAEYLHGKRRYFLNQNGELISKIEGVVVGDVEVLYG